MDTKSQDSSNLERSRPVRTSGVYDGEEEHDLALAGVVTDGFRPPHLTSASESSTTPPASATPEPRPADETPSSSTDRQDDAPIISKPPVPPDASMAGHEPGGLTQQLTDATASIGFVPLDSGPYRGPTGPSHPYDVYAQNSDGIEAAASQPADIPIGFRGLPDQYQRRIGPDGEEMGIVGPDGHTEQLPPYTRYPEEAYGGKPPIAESSGSETDRGANPVAPAAAPATAPDVSPPAAPNISGAGGIGLATRNPEFESTEDPETPQSPNSASSFTSDDSQRAIRGGEEKVSEKKEPPRKWKAWMRRKMCGIVPYWALCLAAFVLVVMAIVLGAVIGSTPNAPKQPPKRDPVWTGFEWFEWVKPIATPPPDLQPLATGTFSLPVIPNIAPNTCIRDTTLSQAWTCQIVTEAWHVTIYKDDNGYRATLNSSHFDTLRDNTYNYGQQPLVVEEPFALQLVTDTLELKRGPAWYQRLYHDKTVIMPEAALGSPQTSSNATRRAVAGAALKVKRQEPLQPGEKVWICTWPNTTFDLFIYAQQNSSFSNWSSKSSSSLFSSTTSTKEPTSPITPPPTALPTTAAEGETETYPKSTSKPSEGPRTDDNLFDGDGHQYQPNQAPRSPPPPFPTNPPITTTITTTETTTTSEAPSSSSTTTGRSPATSPSPPPPMYPRVIKLSEHRIWTRGAPKAQCTQAEIRAPGERAQPVRDSEGKPIVVDIKETEFFIPGGGGSGNGEGGGGGGGGGGGNGGNPEKRQTNPNTNSQGSNDGSNSRSWSPLLERNSLGDHMPRGHVLPPRQVGEIPGSDELPDFGQMGSCACLWFLT
ncbi:hypothetical protein VTJ49DRAFT_895 [Mycothermus thermophilus]|uniref:DUF7820 domain-containing protein n=1 Tax=Humicola insolens TaxID=85995 RepID=A0ABR3VDT6_HUMIN